MTIPSEPITEEKKQEEGRNKRNGAAERFIIPILVSVVSGFLGVLCTIWWNSHLIKNDYFAKANSGDTYSQLFLADYYYEISDYVSSIYWFKVLAQNEGKIGYTAKNNLAILYIKMAEQSNGTDYEYDRAKVASLFFEAMNGGVVEAGRNLYAFIKQMPFEMREDFSSEEMLQQAEGFLDEHEAFDEKLPSSDVKWEYMGTEVGESVPANTNDYEFETVSSDYVFDKQDSSLGMKSILSYKIY